MFERYRRLGRTYLETPGEGGGGAGGNGGGQRLSAADLLARYGASPERLAERLEQAYADNFTVREQKRALTTEVETLKKAQTPDGAVVLTGDAAKAYEAYAALGKPDEVKAALAERDTLKGEVETAKRGETLRSVAESLGWNPAPLKRIGAEREYELRETTIEGKPVKVPYIKDGDTMKPLAEYAATEWADILPALTAQAGGTGQQQQQGGGLTFPRQPGGTGGAKPQNVAQNYVTSTYKGPPQAGARS